MNYEGLLTIGAGGTVFILSGLFCIVSAICNFDFFFSNRRARKFVSLLGRKGARVFYGILGIFLIAMGISFLYVLTI